MPPRRRLDFQWNLRQLMAAHEMFKTTELVPLLRERGVALSATQVYRLVTDKPERLSMRVLVALCDIFACSPNELISPYEAAATVSPAADGTETSAAGPVADLAPERARILDEE